MIGWIVGQVVVFLGSGPAPRPRTSEEAGSRFFFRFLWLLCGLASFVVAAWVLLASSNSTARIVAAVVAVLGGSNVLFCVPRLVALCRDARSLSNERSDEH